MDSIDLSKVLPKELVISGADSHVYRIGLSLFKPKYYVKRSLFYKPIIVFIISIQHVIKSFTLILLPTYNSDEKIYLYLGDIGYYIGFTKEYNSLIILFSFLVIISQFIHYYNYRKGIKPMDLRVFQMISGLISPKSIQINDKLLVYKLCKITKYSLKFAEFCHILTIILMIICDIMVFTPGSSLVEIILVILPNLILWVLWTNGLSNVLFYQIVYYLIINFYIKFEIKLNFKLYLCLKID